MTLRIWIIFGLAFGMNETFALERADLRDIERVISDQALAWNRSDMHAWSAPFTEDGTFVNIFGNVFRGKQEIKDRHVQIFKSFLKDSKMEILKTEFREIRPQVVSATIHWKTLGFQNPFIQPAPKDEPAQGVFSQIFVKEGDHWAITSSHNGLKFSQAHPK